MRTFSQHQPFDFLFLFKPAGWQPPRTKLRNPEVDGPLFQELYVYKSAEDSDKLMHLRLKNQNVFSEFFISVTTIINDEFVNVRVYFEGS